MSYDEEQHRKSRVVIETPTERREVVQHQTVRTPERSGFSAGMVAAVALTAIAATAIIFLFLMNRGDSDNTNVNVRVAAQPTPYVQQAPAIVQPTPVAPVLVPAPAATPIIIVQQAPPAPATTTAAAPPAAAAAPPASSANDDTAIQGRIDRAFRGDAAIFEAGVTAAFLGGKATLNGTVGSEALKERAEKLAYAVKGVQSVDNRITVVPGTP